MYGLAVRKSRRLTLLQRANVFTQTVKPTELQKSIADLVFEVLDRSESKVKTWLWDTLYPDVQTILGSLHGFRFSDNMAQMLATTTRPTVADLLKTPKASSAQFDRVIGGYVIVMQSPEGDLAAHPRNENDNEDDPEESHKHAAAYIGSATDVRVGQRGRTLRYDLRA